MKTYKPPIIIELGEMTAEGYDMGILGTCESPGNSPGRPGTCVHPGAAPL